MNLKNELIYACVYETFTRIQNIKSKFRKIISWDSTVYAFSFCQEAY
jgi:hypothetical protein